MFNLVVIIKVNMVVKRESKLKKQSIAYSCLCVVLFFISVNSFANTGTNKLLSELDKMIELSDSFVNQKLDRIHTLYYELDAAQSVSNKRLEYSINKKLYYEYQLFMYDSAFKYVREMTRIARQMDDKDALNKSKIEFGFTLLSSGLFKESLDTLLSISSKELDIPTKIEYYNVLSRTYFDIAIYSNTQDFYQVYTKKGVRILDSAIALIPDTSEQYWLALAQKRLKAYDYVNAMDAFNYAVSQFELSQHDYAIATSSLGWLYKEFDREDDAVNMLIKAAIADIKNSTKETVALRELAIVFYRRGKVDRAYRYINLALDDANFYRALHRKMEISEILPIIESKRLEVLEKQRKQLLNYGVIITLLSIVVSVLLLIFYKQLKNVRSIRKILQETNHSLKVMNGTLLEANKIKEEYIGFFFSINSEFINRLENYQRTIKRKIASRQFDDLNYIIKSAELTKERENLFKNFDEIFLKIFPHFIEEFNKIFAEEDKIVLDQNELLSAELRIIALIRLGISDSEKIAKFLNYSVNTIYTYKTKLKHKAIVSKDRFDDHIMSIKAL